MKLKLVQTCGACPEQYDAYFEGNKVGYLRLRHGFFYAQHLGATVYEASTIGDGIFDPSERVKHLNAACEAIILKMSESENPRYYDVVDESEVKS